MEEDERGYANLPIAIGSFFGGPLGGRLFERFISEPAQAGEAVNPLAMWLIIAGIGVVSMVGLSIYDRVLVKTRN
ncbi:MAG: hypothetical protein WBC70_03385 [Candidatus Aminicenantales bacterium]